MEEIRDLTSQGNLPPHVPIIPIRMTEAWLLFDEPAIRSAADNPRGTMSLNVPHLANLESLPDPKNTLWNLMLAASGKNGRRLAQFKRDLFSRRQRVAELISDFSPLRTLSAFVLFEEALRSAVNQWSQENLA
jgi:hypothetical protein